MPETTEEDDRITAEEAAKSETTILRESLVLLNRKMDRLAFEASERIEALEARVKELEK